MSYVGLKMTVSKKIIELDNLLKKSEELSSKLLELNNDVDENKLSKSTIDSKKTLKNDIKIIKKIMKEFEETHEKISEISSTFTDEEKEELKKLDLKI
tara:strand:+ start:50 stop:343 length:294 start_codon:yes stop_codon:yes gene_type:complete